MARDLDILMGDDSERSAKCSLSVNKANYALYLLMMFIASRIPEVPVPLYKDFGTSVKILCTCMTPRSDQGQLGYRLEPEYYFKTSSKN